MGREKVRGGPLRCAVAYSGGKDSHLALLAAVEQGLQVEALVYFDGGKLNPDLFHDHSRAEMVRAHGKLAGIPVIILRAGRGFPAARETSTARLMAACCARLGVKRVFCGATAEDDNTRQMRSAAAAFGLRLEAPLEKLDFAGVLKTCASRRVRARIIGVEKSKRLLNWLGRGAGRALSAYCVRRAKSGWPVDGNDFQTVVLESPLFRGSVKPMAFSRWEGGGQVFCEIKKFRVRGKNEPRDF